MKIDRTQRKIAAEKLHIIGVIGYAINHELYRVAKVHGKGLTPGELKWIDELQRDHRAMLEKVTTIMTRTQK